MIGIILIFIIYNFLIFPASSKIMSLSRPYTIGGAGFQGREITALVHLEDALSTAKKESIKIIRSPAQPIQQTCCPPPPDLSQEISQVLLCQPAAFFEKPKKGARDLRERNVVFSVDKDCKCGKQCLKKLKIDGEYNYDYAADVLGAARLDIHQQGYSAKSQQKDNLRAAFYATIRGSNQNGRLNHVFELGPQEARIQVCRYAWATAHNVSVIMLETLAREYKQGAKSSSRALNDSSHSCSTSKAAKSALENSGLEVTEDRLKVMVLAGTMESRECYEWMEDYFNIAGDHMPNSKEIHLENMKILTLYNKYLKEAIFPPLSYKAWRNIWTELFPHVKIREFKQVTGKCQTCTLLTALRAQFTHTNLKRLVTELHELHRLSVRLAT